MAGTRWYWYTDGLWGFVTLSKGPGIKFYKLDPFTLHVQLAAVERADLSCYFAASTPSDLSRLLAAIGSAATSSSWRFFMEIVENRRVRFCVFPVINYCPGINFWALWKERTPPPRYNTTAFFSSSSRRMASTRKLY